MASSDPAWEFCAGGSMALNSSCTKESSGGFFKLLHPSCTSRESDIRMVQSRCFVLFSPNSQAILTCSQAWEPGSTSMSRGGSLNHIRQIRIRLVKAPSSSAHNSQKVETIQCSLTDEWISRTYYRYIKMVNITQNIKGMKY